MERYGVKRVNPHFISPNLGGKGAVCVSPDVGGEGCKFVPAAIAGGGCPSPAPSPGERGRRGGFTLVELLLAATLGALVVTAAFASIALVLHGYKQYKNRSDAYEPARAALARMNREISSAFLSPHTGRTRFVGVPQMVEGIELDRLTFISVVNNPQRSLGGESDLCEIEYFIDSDTETPERWLQVRYDPTPDEDPFTGGVCHLLGPNVVSMTLYYFDGEFWLNEWDSTEQIPMAVNITLGVLKRDAKSLEELELFSTIAYPMAYRDAGSEETNVETTSQT